MTCWSRVLRRRGSNGAAFLDWMKRCMEMSQ
jgi:hypothetical protein